MKQKLFIAIAILLSFSFNKDSKTFSGKIIYVNTFSDLKNNDLKAKLVAYFGQENNYFINDSNYKAYNENNVLLYLYNCSTNNYYSFDRKEKIAKKVNAEKITSKNIEVNMLPGKETICGYECSSLEVKTENGTTVFFFSPLIYINKTNFAKHNYGEWNSYLNATNGAIPLKIIYKSESMGFTWTSAAKEVSKLSLAQKDFEFPKDVTLKNE
jgi:hypothetical protein